MRPGWQGWYLASWLVLSILQYSAGAWDPGDGGDISHPDWLSLYYRIVRVRETWVTGVISHILIGFSLYYRIVRVRETRVTGVISHSLINFSLYYRIVRVRETRGDGGDISHPDWLLAVPAAQTPLLHSTRCAGRAVPLPCYQRAQPQPALR